MKNNTYKILFYLAFSVTLGLFLYCTKMSVNVILNYSLISVLLILSFLSFIISNIFIFKSKKPKITNKDVILPIIYMIFAVIIVVSMIIYNKDAVIPYLHYMYYYVLLLIPYISLNIYTIGLYKKG